MLANIIINDANGYQQEILVVVYTIFDVFDNYGRVVTEKLEVAYLFFS